MTFIRKQRSVIALLLYSCVLFSSFACALGHGQSSGLQLSGLDQRLCSSSDAGKNLPAAPASASSFECPVCSGHNLVSGPLNGWSVQLALWLPNPSPAVSNSPTALASPLWPPANPRAPPLA